MIHEKWSPKLAAVSPELRGWAWDEAPIAPLMDNLKLGVSEVSSRYCESRRDIYLKKVLKMRPKTTQPMLRGKAVHSLIVRVLKFLKKEMLKEPGSGSELYMTFQTKRVSIVKEILKKLSLNDDFEHKLSLLYNYLALQLSAEYDKLLSEAPEYVRSSVSEKISGIISERLVDGSRIGLSSWLMIDVYIPPMTIVEIKTGALRDFHVLSLAGYALALESSEYTPVNHGCLLYVHLNNGVYMFKKLVKISDDVRREFLEERDQVMEIIYSERDPGMPNTCPQSCPFYYYCRGDGE